MALKIKHLLGLEGVEKKDLELILNTAKSFKEVIERPVKKVPPLRGVTVVNLFYEPSTRTRLSFELAEKRLSADTLNFSAKGSSVAKGESLKDTVRNIEALKIDMIVIRHSSVGAPHYLTKFASSTVINAGDGAHEHPTQALLDMYSIMERYGRIKGLRVVIIGDILHSRVARSNIWGLKTLGASVAICGPTTLLPYEVEKMGVDVYHNLDEALDGADVVNVLRLQRERQQAGLLPSLREYTTLFGITKDRLKLLNKNYTIMHPGPINRGVEITSEVADSESSIILEQVTNGVAVRMSVLYLLRGGEEAKS
ncbi:MAG: aspartate carbamoyltransferase catalytic subunit [candidate division Zixibacteria bacterium]|jgi:aspartate carbamoyltransferase catalytic subunit|nr:aspartate carbamoyltransferase catalytic subunit [candidate division Zixibacteria bacterium]NIW94068.1 aspartate carbamoyltransferase catalytic subunit [Phycisphaerae bacterium]NIR65762.1 aspartate carbamoyltransferase catalytic subunit [candidate division Zixibacteria bacterium]NIS16294.1 aspartate carbamoyltransferase catalytic subunit [candidate division Zixibacteria bacterium]NIT52667.1 aspartate carbamoyltransferase catalytic subunit [candidate division Zixibacteria bacterium]